MKEFYGSNEILDELYTLLDSYDLSYTRYRWQYDRLPDIFYSAGFALDQLDPYHYPGSIITDEANKVHSSDSIVMKSFISVYGKEIEELGLGEVGISRALFDSLDIPLEDVLGQPYDMFINIDKEFVLYQSDQDSQSPPINKLMYYDELTSTFTIEAIVDDISAEKMKAMDDELSLSFFNSDEREKLLVLGTEAYDQLIQERHQLAVTYLNAVMEFVGEDFIDPSLLEDHSFLKEYGPSVIAVVFDHYSSTVEDQLAKDISLIINTDNFERTATFRLDKLSSKLQKEPLVNRLLQVVSKFVLSGVLISSFYSFYIHLKNQIRTSTKEITSLLMQGVRWTRILWTYYLELFLVLATALMLFGTLSIMMSIVNTNTTLYTHSFLAYSKSLMLSCGFFVLILILITISLYPFKKNVLSQFKNQSKTRVQWTGFSQKGMIIQFSIKRVFTYIASSLGYALSISLVVLMIVMSFSASYHIKNVYSKETFGMHFDYIVSLDTEDEDAAWATYYDSQQYTKDYAFIYKEEGILFMDHDLWEGNSNYYRSSMIVFLNEIEPFVNVYEGSYPVHYSEIAGLEGYGDLDAIVSRRHVDRRDAKLTSKEKTEKRVEDSYLFYYDRYNSYYESAFRINGVENTLFNNGWAVYGYQPVYVSLYGEIDSDLYQEFVVNLKDDTDVGEFESFLDSRDVSYVKYDALLDSFQVRNDAMNATSILISISVMILMTLLLLVNLSGLIVSVRLEHFEDNLLMRRMGVSEVILNRIGIEVFILRTMLSIVFFGGLMFLVYPRYFSDVLGAFGLYSMPGSILGTVGFIVAASSFVLMVIYIGLGYRRKRQ